MALYKVVGEEWITRDIIEKEKNTKNTRKQTIHRNICRYLVLSCGHKVRVSDLTTKAAKQKSMGCYYCENNQEQVF